MVVVLPLVAIMNYQVNLHMINAQINEYYFLVIGSLVKLRTFSSLIALQVRRQRIQKMMLFLAYTNSVFYSRVAHCKTKMA